MKRTTGPLVLVAVALGVAAFAPPYARGIAAGRPAASAPLDPVQVNSLSSMLDGFKWGMTHTDVLTAYNKLGGIIDHDYDPMLRKVQPGPQMQALEAERDNRKAQIERSYLQLVFPVGLDGTGLRSEYTYKNNESLLVVDRQGKKRYFFFIGQAPGERLWKIYDEIPLSETGPVGATYQEAVTRLQGAVGKAGRVRAADKDAGLTFTTVDWQDGTTHLRAVDRTAEHVVGVVVEERATLNALPQLRSHKEEDPMAIDPSISAVTRGSISDPNNDKPAPSASASTKPPKRR